VRVAEHNRYIEEVAVSSSPRNLDALLRVLVAKDQELVPPSRRAGLHPLFIPLVKGPATEGATPDASIRGGEVFTGLLRWPGKSTMVSVCHATCSPWRQFTCRPVLPADVRAASQGLPLVRMSREAPALTLLSRNTDEYLHRFACIRCVPLHNPS
jgi:hypothetical protein